MAEHILWLDLETTGTAPDAVVLEVGTILTDARPPFRVVDSFASPIQWLKLPPLDDAVYRMHSGNGLLDDLRSGKGLPWDIADDGLVDMLRGHHIERLPLAGSGVSHFDRAFVNTTFPQLAKRLHYWSFDIGVVRRMMQTVGIEPPHVGNRDKPHRALDCAYRALVEGRCYFDMLSRSGPPWDVPFPRPGEAIVEALGLAPRRGRVRP